MIWMVRIIGLLLVSVTLLPLIPTGQWFVRLWDFPRLQVAVVLFVVLLLAGGVVYRSSSKLEPFGWSIVLAAAFVWQASHVIPFSPLWSKDVPVASPDANVARMMVANLAFDNPHHAEAARQIRAESPDVLLLIEIDAHWKEGLRDLRRRYRNHHEEIRDDGLGIALWSNLKLDQAETRYLVSQRRPSIWARLELPNRRTVQFVGVHPTPPGLDDSTTDGRRDSRVRDAELVLIAREIAQHQDQAWIVAGDFNDVAWSHTTRLFKRISGLNDPRIGRSFMGTFIAQYPPFRCPIDHVFLSDGFTLRTLARKRITGSDHFAVLAAFDLNGIEPGVTPEPEGDDDAEARQLIEEGKQDAQQRDVEASP